MIVDMPQKPIQESPALRMARIILFTAQIDEMSRFYGAVLGLEQVTDEKGWREFTAGGVTIGLHSGPPSPGRKGPKIAFYAEDVLPCAQPSWHAGPNSRKSEKVKRSAFATARTPTEIQFSYPVAKTHPSSRDLHRQQQLKLQQAASASCRTSPPRGCSEVACPLS